MTTVNADSATIAATLRDGAALDLLLRLQRGKPRTIEQIREVAPHGIDLGAGLTELERAGLIRIDHDGLRIQPPEQLIVGAVLGSLHEAHRRLDEWRGLLSSLTPTAGRKEDAQSELVPGDTSEAAASLRFVAGEASALRGWVLQEGGINLSFAVPGSSQAHAPLSAWLEAAGDAPNPTGSRLLIEARALNNTDLTPLLDKLVLAGVNIQLTGTVPFWLVFAECSRAMLSADEGNQPLSGMYLTESQPIISALGAVFDSWWARSLRYPLSGNLAEDGLGLRAQGFNDNEAAQALGTSTRTLQREHARLMEEIGVRSRFELGVWWSKNRAASDSPQTEPSRRITQEGTR